MLAGRKYRLRAQIHKVASVNAPVLIWGESGSGKEIAAQAIHEASPRASGAFVPINCGAIPANLIQSELFGHQRGAFTGASKDKAGLIETAAGGTVFLDEIADLPKDLRARLSEVARAGTLTVESRYLSADGTRRYLMKTHDGFPVETVFIPEERRDTICFSSQSGCPLQCTFCLTAQLGLLRSLTAGEIVEQIVIALNDAYGVGVKPPRGTNLVGMGAGEPFLNFDSLLQALRVMADPQGLHIVPNRVTISTAGVVPRILELATVPDRPHLAISLAAPTDELRNELMPINKKWPLEQLLAACKEFEKTLKPNERVTFEYVMLAGVNDDDEPRGRRT